MLIFYAIIMAGLYLMVISAKLLYAYTCRRVAPAGILLEWDGSEAKVCAMPR